MIPASKLAEWRAAADKATPGPWSVRMGDIVQLTDSGQGFPLDYYPDSKDIAARCDCGNGGLVEDENAAFIVAAREAVPALLAENDELRQALDAASGPHCPSCGNSIDPETCHCGIGTDVSGHDNHTPVPMGCVCGFVEPDWQALATTRGEHMHRLRVEIARLRERLNPTIEDHDRNPPRYWAERELERDEHGNRIPRLADCDWPKKHLRDALDRLALVEPVFEAAKNAVMCFREREAKRPTIPWGSDTQRLVDAVDAAIAASPPPLHCWEDSPRSDDDVGSTCMLPAEHAGEHEFTRDDAIGVSFVEVKS